MAKPRTVLREVDRALIQAVMFRLGILPMEKTDLDMRRALSQLTTEESRVMKRKFRKMWRKAMRAEIGNDSRTKDVREFAVKQRLGVGKHAPSRAEHNARKKIVFDLLWGTVIKPMIKKFDNPDVNKVTSPAKKTQKSVEDST